VRAFPVAFSPSPPLPPSPGAAGEGGEHTVGRFVPADAEGEVGAILPRQTGYVAQRAKELRRDATGAEGMLWEELRGRKLAGRKFRRQHPIGRFIADFYCDDAKLIIELDGFVHAEPTQQERDAIREEILARFIGVTLLRFTNHQVINEREKVLQTIANFVNDNKHESPLTPPSPAGYPLGAGEGVAKPLAGYPRSGWRGEGPTTACKGGAH
jgi:very-short-patch-repair endonuclease